MEAKPLTIRAKSKLLKPSLFSLKSPSTDFSEPSENIKGHFLSPQFANGQVSYDSLTHISPKNIQNFDDFISNCNTLQKHISIVNDSIEKSLTIRKPRIKLNKELKYTIRNAAYLKGVKLIEDRVQRRKQEQEPENVKKVKKFLLNNITENDSVFEPEEMSSRAVIECLSTNKREFGRLLDHVKEVKPKTNFKAKSIDIVINPQQTIIEELKSEEAAKEMKSIKRKYSMELITKNNETIGKSADKLLPNLDRKKYKRRLPPLNLTKHLMERTKEEANRFFTGRKTLEEKLKVNRKKLANFY